MILLFFIVWCPNNSKKYRNHSHDSNYLLFHSILHKLMQFLIKHQNHSNYFLFHSILHKLMCFFEWVLFFSCRYFNIIIYYSLLVQAFHCATFTIPLSLHLCLFVYPYISAPNLLEGYQLSCTFKLTTNIFTGPSKDFLEAVHFVRSRRLLPEDCVL